MYWVWECVHELKAKQNLIVGWTSGSGAVPCQLTLRFLQYTHTMRSLHMGRQCCPLHSLAEIMRTLDSDAPGQMCAIGGQQTHVHMCGAHCLLRDITLSDLATSCCSRIYLMQVMMCNSMSADRHHTNFELATSCCSSQRLLMQTMICNSPRPSLTDKLTLMMSCLPSKNTSPT